MVDTRSTTPTIDSGPSTTWPTTRSAAQNGVGVPERAVSLRHLAAPLAAIVVLHLALMLVWSVVVPTFRGADEHVHHDFLRHLTDTWEYPEYDELRVNQRTLFGIADSPVYDAHAPAAGADAAEPRDQRSSWTDLGPDVRDGPFNQLAQHPPLYYVPTAAVLRVLDGDGSAPVDRVVWQLRLLNVLALLPLPLLAADVARRFTSSALVVLASAAAVVAVPQLAHLGATLSNDPLMVLFGAVTVSGVARLLTGDRRWGTAALTGVAAGLALLSKGFAVPLVPAVALACLLPLWPGRQDAAPGGGRVAAFGRGVVVAGLALVVGGWWWIRNVVVHGNPQPGVRLRERVAGVEADVVEFAGNFGERLVDSFWGNVGWREARLPLSLSVALTIALVVAVAVGCWGRWRRLVLVVPAVVAFGMVLSAGWGAYKKTGVSYATQGRYLYAALTALLALAMIGVARMGTDAVRRHQPTLVLAGGLAVHGAMIAIAVRRYWAGGGVDRLEALVAFSPLPDALTWSFLGLAPVAALVALVVVWQDSIGLADRSAVRPAQHD